MNLNELLNKYIEIKVPEYTPDKSIYFYVFNVTDVTDDMIKADLIIGVDDIGATFYDDLDAFDKDKWKIKEFANKESLINQSLMRTKEVIYNQFNI